MLSQKDLDTLAEANNRLKARRPNTKASAPSERSRKIAEIDRINEQLKRRPAKATAMEQPATRCPRLDVAGTKRDQAFLLENIHVQAVSAPLGVPQHRFDEKRTERMRYIYGGVLERRCVPPSNLHVNVRRSPSPHQP